MVQQGVRLTPSEAATVSMADVRARLGQSESDPRQDAVARVVAELTSGFRRGVVIVGGHGVGKSFIAQRAIKQLHDDHLVVQVRGSSTTSTLEYGALSILLNDLETPHLQHPVMVLRGLTQLLKKRAQGRTILLFVDNAHDLDDLSSMVIAQLAAGGHIRLLAVCRELQHESGDIMGLWKDNLLQRVDVGTLSLNESAAILKQEFPGSFSVTALRALCKASGGNALALLALTKEQIEHGILTCCRGVWILGSKPIQFTGEVRGIAKAFLSHLSPGQRDVVELLALSGALPLPTLMRAVQPADVDSLQEISVIEVTAGQPPLVQITDAVTANAVAGIVPPGRSIYLRSRLSSATTPLPSPAFQPVKDVAWALDCGESVTVEQAVTAAQAANQISDATSALRFIREIDSLELASAAGAESVIARLSNSSHERGLALVQAFDAAISRKLPLTEWMSLQLIGTVIDRRSRVAPDIAKLRLKDISIRLLEQTAPSDVSRCQYQDRLRMAEAHVASFEGRHRDVLMLLQNPLIDNSSDEDAVAAASLRCIALAALGDLPRALDEWIPVERSAYDSYVSDRTAREVRAGLLQVMLLCGEFSVCEGYMTKLLISDEAHSRLGGIAEIVPGLIELHRGNIAGAIALLETGSRQLKYRDEDALHDLGMASCAFASALQQDEAKTRRFLAEIGQSSVPVPWLTDRLTRYYQLRAIGELELDDAVDKLLEAEADDDSCASALHFLAAVGRDSPGVGDKLSNAAQRARGSFSELCRQLGEGIKERDSQLLLAVCRQAQKAGNAIMARDVARISVNYANSSGDRLGIRAAHRAQQALDEFFRRAPNEATTPALGTLTTRECEIATAAAAGISNRKIAEQMHVSVRTVEGHLYQVYAKLHVASRAELREVISAGSGGTPAELEFTKG